MLVPVGPFRKVPCGGGVLPNIINPRSLPGLELDLEAWLGLSGAHNSTVASWPDQSGNARNAGNDASFGNAGVMKLQTTSNLTPSGQKTVRFSGADFPSAVVGINTNPTPWPAATSGYTFYAIFNGLATPSSSGLQILFNEAAGNFRWVSQGAGSKWEYRDQAGTNRDTNTTFATGWQTARAVVRAAGTVDYYIANALATWQGGWNQQWNLTPGALSGYTIGNLATNYVVGAKMDLGALLWFSREHTAQQQQGVENYLRLNAGLALLT